MKQISDDPNEMDIHSPFDKVRFLIQYIGQRNQQSLNIGLVGFSLYLPFGCLRSALQSRTADFTSTQYLYLR